jgi:outer membrane protein with beta-barrel domain
MRVRLMNRVAAACILLFAGGFVLGQSEVSRFEVGAQYSLLNFDTSASFSKPRRWESGGGGRFTYNFNKYVAAEAQIDYYPNDDSERIGTINVPLWGSKTLTVFGVKAGTRRDRFGIFAKARPGFIHFSHVPGFACVTGPCLQPAKTNFAFDVGGVVEYYPSSRLVVRFDAGDTIIRHKSSSEPRTSFRRAWALACAFEFTQYQLVQ